MLFKLSERDGLWKKIRYRRPYSAEWEDLTLEEALDICYPLDARRGRIFSVTQVPKRLARAVVRVASSSVVLPPRPIAAVRLFVQGVARGAKLALRASLLCL